jgi:hypothetical protein
MKMCMPHWEELKAAIDAAGMGHLVSKDEATALASLDPANNAFDPLMSCTMSLYNSAIREGGMYLMFAKEDGTEYCPCCEAALNDAPNWVAQIVEDCLTHAREQGLVPKVQ